MSTDEQRVRTEAGWIGVELSKSRVRTPGKAGYGLYRVRGSTARGSVAVGGGTLTAWQEGEWTSYAFTLDEIARSIEEAIGYGVPAGPRDMVLNRSNPKHGERPAVIVPTRWTSTYRGSRVLGLRGEAEAVAALAGAGLDPRPTDEASMDVALLSYDPEVRETARQRQRAANAEFQREHVEARAHGLEARHRAKLAARPPVQRLADYPGSARGTGWVAGL